MNNKLKIAKQQFYELIKLPGVFIGLFLVIALIALIIKGFGGHLDNQDGIGYFLFYLMFLSGIIAFTGKFRILMSFNITRRSFLLGNLIAFALIAFATSIFLAGMDSLIPLILPYTSNYSILYHNTLFINDFIYTLVLYFLMLELGFFTGLLFYKMNKMVKLLLLFFPFYFLLLLILFSTFPTWRKQFYKFSHNALNYCLGFNSSSYAAVLTFSISIMLVSGIIYLIIRKLEVKDR